MAAVCISIQLLCLLFNNCSAASMKLAVGVRRNAAPASWVFLPRGYAGICCPDVLTGQRITESPGKSVPSLKSSSLAKNPVHKAW
jgi:hypothetical protein